MQDLDYHEHDLLHAEAAQVTAQEGAYLCENQVVNPDPSAPKPPLPWMPQLASRLAERD